MCGIAGCFYNNNKNSNKNIKIIKDICLSLRHRGPDDIGYYSNKQEKIIFSHNRLSILDLSKKASQPFKSFNDNKVISYNGEIYNHLDIRKFLKKKNFKISWKTTSDTETLIECIDKIGLDRTLKKIRGMFSFALWDRKSKNLFLVRDRFGEKPLYFFEYNKSFFFTSEIGKLDKFLDKKLILNKDSVNSFLHYNYIPGPNSIYKEVKKVLPGTYLKIKFTKGKIIKDEISYWKPKPFFQINNFINKEKKNKYLDKFENILSNVVKDTLISDVPIGIFLSSGVDSSLIASITKSVTKKKINTFSLGVLQNNDYNELKAAENISKHLNSNHYSFEIKEKEIIENIENALNKFDEPFADSSQILMNILCKKSKNHIKVALTGDGGDELFGGYNRHFLIYYLEKSMKLLNINSFNNLFIQKFISNTTELIPIKLLENLFAYSEDKYKKIKNISKFSSETNLYQKLISNNNEIEINSLLSSKLNNQSILYGRKNDSFLLKLMLSDIKNYLPNDILVKVDRTSMSFGLECRSPLLDLRVYDFARKLPNNLRFRNFKGKFLLRQLLQKYLPRNIIPTKKKGFSFSVNEVLKKKQFINWSEKLLSPKVIKKNRFLNHDNVNKIIQSHKSGNKDLSNTIWSLLVLQNWFKKRNFFN
jgi:asparagine synthase (glutamine-hydrolysing)